MSEDAHGFYDDIDIYLNTSLHEGLPLSILEAMAKGKPVVDIWGYLGNGTLF